MVLWQIVRDRSRCGHPSASGGVSVVGDLLEPYQALSPGVIVTALSGGCGCGFMPDVAVIQYMQAIRAVDTPE
jgi:hypothetical protein